MSRFFKDTQSQNIFQEFITVADTTAVPELTELTANTTDAAQEKHVPVVTIKENLIEVSVGSVAHPMLEEHYITGIYIETKYGFQFKKLAPEDEPKAEFLLTDGDEFIAAYEYCNLHGLWKKDNN